MTFTTKDKKRKPKNVRLWAIAFWLIVWECVARLINQEIFLVSPLSVLKKIAEFIITWDFWNSIFFSLWRIGVGFLLATVLGILFAGLSARFTRIKELLSPFILILKAIPVASFIILSLVWISSKNLSVLTSFMIVFPIIYTGILEGIQNTDQKLLEMSDVFQIAKTKRFRYIYVSQVLPFFHAACSVALGLSWKTGVAAEILGIPDGSIGEKLYKAKIFLNTPDLFAWTTVIILVSFLFEKVFLFFIRRIVSRLEE